MPRGIAWLYDERAEFGAAQIETIVDEFIQKRERNNNKKIKFCSAWSLCDQKEGFPVYSAKLNQLPL